MFVRTFGKLFGPHCVHISQPSHLVEHFNSHLERCCILFGDECFWAGDRTHEGVLKALVTEPTLMIERKGIDAIQMPNRIHLFMASNTEWTVPVGAFARRFFILDVSTSRRGDYEYFDRIEAQMQNGGYSALMHVLVTRDLRGFDIRDVSNTTALAKQKEHSRRDIDKLVETLCHDGVLPFARITDPDIALTGGEGEGKGFYAAVIRVVPSLKNMGGIRIARALTRDWGCTSWRNNHQRGLRFPPLPELRAKFEAKWGKQDWPDDVQEWSCDSEWGSSRLHRRQQAHADPYVKRRRSKSPRHDLDEGIPFLMPLHPWQVSLAVFTTVFTARHTRQPVTPN